MSTEKKESNSLLYFVIGLFIVTLGLLVLLTIFVTQITQEREESQQRARQTQAMYESLYKEKARADSVIAANCIQWARK